PGGLTGRCGVAGGTVGCPPNELMSWMGTCLVITCQLSVPVTAGTSTSLPLLAESQDCEVGMSGIEVPGDTLNVDPGGRRAIRKEPGYNCPPGSMPRPS